MDKLDEIKRFETITIFVEIKIQIPTLVTMFSKEDNI